MLEMPKEHDAGFGMKPFPPNSVRFSPRHGCTIDWFALEACLLFIYSLHGRTNTPLIHFIVAGYTFEVSPPASCVQINRLRKAAQHYEATTRLNQ